MTDRMLVQITRGVAPAQAIADAVQAADDHGIPYRLVSGLPAVEAKTLAAELAVALKNSDGVSEDEV